MKRLYFIALGILVITLFTRCTLDKEDYGLLSENSFPTTEKDWEAAMTFVYEPLAGRSGGMFHGMLMSALTTFPELATDVMDCYWNWDRFDKHQYNNSNMLWASENLDPFGKYQYITMTQAFIERVKNAQNISESRRKEMIAEAKTIKAYMMYRLYTVFGPVPIIPDDKVLDTTDMTFYPRLSDAEYIAIVQNLIEEAIPDLKHPKEYSDRSHMNKGIAYMIAMKIFMVGNPELWNTIGEINGKVYNDKERWITVKHYAESIINLDFYEMQKTYSDVFSINNQNNKEIIYAVSLKVGVNGNEYHAHVMPALHPWTKEYNVQTSEGYTLPWDFVDSFDKTDLRYRNNIIKSFTGIDGMTYDREHTDAKTFKKGAVPFKYDMDPGHVGEYSNHDYVVFRYADVMLAMAEAVNEIEGVPTNAYKWIEKTRSRAGLMPLPQQDNQERFRERILDERGFELFLEGHRFVDLVRHNKFVEKAYNTPGSDIKANDMETYGYKTRFPIPIDYINEYGGILQQNPGY